MTPSVEPEPGSAPQPVAAAGRPDPRAPEAVAAPAPAEDAAPVPPPRRRLRRALVAVGVVVLLLLLAAGWLASRAAQAADGLTEAGAVLADLESGLAGGDVEALADGLPGLQEDTARARAAASDPVWRLAEHVPWAGPNLAAVRTVAVAVDDVATGALPAVVELGDLVADPQLRRADGSIDLGLFTAAAPALDRAATTTRASATAVAALDTTGLADRVAGPVTQVADGLGTAADALGSASDAARLLPPMLGADGPRTYLLLSLNSAELRSAGGIVGAVAAFTADQGTIRLVDQRSTLDLPPLDAPVLPLTDEELAVHSDRLGRWVQNTVLTPDFPRSAELVSAMWARSVGTPVDGVLAMDPVAVAYLLDATGPVQAGGVELTPDTVLDVLLREAYVRLPEAEEADAFYAEVASALFTAVSSGRGDTRDLLDALARAGDERRVRVWSAHPDEQDRLARTSLGADFLARPGDAAYAVRRPGAETSLDGAGVDTSSPAGAPGVFLNDGSAGKLDYFLTTDLTVEELRCAAAPTTGWATAVLRLDLAYAPPGDIARYPRYVTGTADTGLPVGGVATNVTVYAPPGGRVLDQRLGDQLVGGAAATEQERAVSTLTSRLLPGERATYRFTVTVPAPEPGERLDVWTTPTLTQPGTVTGTCTD